MNNGYWNKAFIISLHVSIWAVFLSLPYLFRPPRMMLPVVDEINFKFAILSFNCLLIGFFYLNLLVLAPRWLNAKSWPSYLAALFCSAFVVFILQQTFVYLVLFKSGNVPELPVPMIFFSFIPILAISTGVRLAMDRIQLNQRSKERETEHLKSELSFLRSQVSPHFMFNVLNSLVALARKKSDQLEPSLLQLSELMRYMLYETTEGKVSLESEINYLQSYIDLQKLRFQDRIPVVFEIALDQQQKVYIEPMLLIPFVENAFKHGTGWMENPAIEIQIVQELNQLELVVKNRFNTVSALNKDQDSGIGLANVRRRLGLLYPQQHQLSTTVSVDHFFIAQLRVCLDF
jgi:hypothetical protein